jgi:DIS3-like exonuclease 2 C terminal
MLEICLQVGCVVSVLDHAVDVLLADLGLVRRAYLDKLNIASYNVKRHNAINYLDLGKSNFLCW